MVRVREWRLGKSHEEGSLEGGRACHGEKAAGGVGWVRSASVYGGWETLSARGAARREVCPAARPSSRGFGERPKRLAGSAVSAGCVCGSWPA